MTREGNIVFACAQCEYQPEYPWLCTEDILLKSLALNKKTLDVLRSRRKFPFINLTKTKRLYYLPDVCEWLLRNKRVLNQASGDLG